ncbi:hypothetical protein D3C76_1139030 [compost metagenome]
MPLRAESPFQACEAAVHLVRCLFPPRAREGRLKQKQTTAMEKPVLAMAVSACVIPVFQPVERGKTFVLAHSHFSLSRRSRTFQYLSQPKRFAT